MAPALSDLQPQPAPQTTTVAQTAIGNGLVTEAQAFADELAAWRHDLHQTPELGNNLPQTSAFIQARLDEMDIPYAVLVDGSCVVGLIGAGAAAAARGNGTCADDQAGTVIMLRGDMDALPVAEESGEPFASINGCMHACGHDMHATALLGAARLLKVREAELVDANATVKLLFQPGEETFEGARAAIADGLLENPRPQAAFAMHVNSQSPLGLVLYGSPALSGVYGFRITLQGKGGHGSSPEICIDPITAAAHIHIALQEINSRELKPGDFGVLTTGRFEAGAASNVIPDVAQMWGTIRTTDPEKLRLMRTLGADKRQILWLLVFPANCPTLFSTLKVNVGLSWVGVIMGEFLVSRAGLGYLIVYGSQVFNMDLVMASVLVLGLAAVGMYLLVLRAEAFLNHLWGVRA